MPALGGWAVSHERSTTVPKVVIAIAEGAGVVRSLRQATRFHLGRGAGGGNDRLQGCLAQKKQSPPRTLHKDHAPMAVLGVAAVAY